MVVKWVPERLTEVVRVRVRREDFLDDIVRVCLMMWVTYIRGV